MLIKCPHCAFAREMEESHVPTGRSIVTCPKCHNKFPFLKHDELDDSSYDLSSRSEKAYGKDTRPDGQWASSSKKQNAFSAPNMGLEQTCPWEATTSGDYLRKFVNSIKMVMFKPQIFFSTMPRTDNYAKSLIFAMIMALISSVVSLMVTKMTLNDLGSLGETEVDRQALAMLENVLNQTSFLFLLFMSMVIHLIGIFLFAFIYHFLLRLMHGTQFGYVVTFKTLCYSYAPNILIIIPVIGGIASTLWSLAAFITGCRYAQQATYGKIVLAGIMAFVIICILILLIALFFAILTPDAFQPSPSLS